MISRIVLCAFTNRMTAGVWRFGRLDTCEVFQNDEPGLNRFREFLHHHKNIPISLIADAVEEDYRVETAPHTSGMTRHVLLQRKLNQLYRNSVYRAAQFIGRESGLRRDDQFLLVALSNTESIQPWVIAIEEQQAPLTGVYLLPMVSQFIIERLKLGAPHLLMMDGMVSGLRQTYFHNGKLRVSRLAPSLGSADPEDTALYLAETEKTRLYLLSQRLIAADTKLSLLVLTDGEGGEVVCRQIRSELNLECLALDSTKLANLIGLGREALHKFPELIYMQTVAKGSVPVNLAPEEQTRHFQVYRLRSWIGYTAAAVLVSGLALAALNVRDVMDYQAQHQQATVQTQDFERRYAEVARNFPATPLPGNDLKTVVEMSKTIAANTRTPERLMQVVSVALDTLAEIQLQRLRWKLTDDLNTKDEIVAGQAGAASAGGNQMPAGGVPGTLREIGFVDGEIRNFNGDYRAALNSVNRLAEQIRQDPQVETVVVVQQPVNVSAHSNLQGSTLDEQTQQMPAATFKLKIILKQVVTL